ncbi:MAG: COX15/CtaA family protein [Gemmatimonadota bacterium]|jgi:heme A synthase|nr:COX15/CtaA family protein [Gemmatimonadota bacterium]
MKDRFAGFAGVVTGYNLLVILWGAYVRATGSGAGCGSHWPLCNGEVVPRSATVEMMVEFTHRITSGVALVLVVALWFWARRARPSGHIARTGATLSVVFILVEALLGAGLVLFELVADDASAFRAVSMVLHLVNTFLLIGVLGLTTWWAMDGERPRIARSDRRVWLLGVAMLGLLVVGATGAIAALGDTLFPATSLEQGLRESFSSNSHILLRLRKYHPLMAILTGLYVVFLTRQLASTGSDKVKRLASVAGIIYLLQLAIGATNMILLAPVATQMLHLLFADLVWINLVVLAAAVLVPEEMAGAPSRTAGGRLVSASSGNA